ncbi:hypothetical protein [Azomonas macrocytogenes]|uniref:Uncharacterized protein n=1 Tax=Azomonas macrocytogenes TaxID=69962 RepID=A0A839T438_AZOMA|nr:hypothetical protein [Azomonas macrocytogenes]MBB3103769.1 hypothetical protein [Azomonas macrocytogenes]
MKWRKLSPTLVESIEGYQIEKQGDRYQAIWQSRPIGGACSAAADANRLCDEHLASHGPKACWMVSVPGYHPFSMVGAAMLRAEAMAAVSAIWPGKTVDVA